MICLISVRLQTFVSTMIGVDEFADVFERIDVSPEFVDTIYGPLCSGYYIRCRSKVCVFSFTAQHLYVIKIITHLFYLYLFKLGSIKQAPYQASNRKEIAIKLLIFRRTFI